MAQLSSVAERKKNLQANRLEVCLQGIYQEECEFKIDKEEVDFLQQGIETLVHNLIDNILDDENIVKDLEQELEKLERKSTEFTVYFPSELDERFKKFISHKAECIPLIGVGSFYEGTRNAFPDEFDFIFPLLTVSDEKDVDKYFFDILKFSIIEEFCHNFEKDKHDIHIRDGKRTIDFLKLHYQQHGPALLIQFEYNNSFNDKRIINVDLVLAIRSPVAKIKMADIYKKKLSDKYEDLKSFHDKIMSQENLLYINPVIADFNTSVVHLETDFIRSDLSENHRKVYRILKYLINGEVDEDKLKKAFPPGNNIGYSSYHIKMMILYHHDTCRDSGTEDLGPCVLQVLEDMSKYEDTFRNYSMFMNNVFTKRFVLLPHLKRLLETLRGKQSQTGMYEYETEKMKSISRQFLDDCSTKTGETSSSDTNHK